MTWGEIKKQIEAGGVTDEMDLWYIDISAGHCHDGKLTVCPQNKNGTDSLGFTVGD